MDYKKIVEFDVFLKLKEGWELKLGKKIEKPHIVKLTIHESQKEILNQDMYKDFEFEHEHSALFIAHFVPEKNIREYSIYKTTQLMEWKALDRLFNLFQSQGYNVFYAGNEIKTLEVFHSEIHRSNHPKKIDTAQEKRMNP